jgi:hypothetical protein
MCSTTVDMHHTGERGHGLYAKRAFAVGEELLRELPLLTWSAVRSQPGDKHSAQEMLHRAVRERFDALSGAKKETVMSLTDAFRFDGEPSLRGIINSNGLPIGHADDEARTPQQALFALTCRLNHSCKSNARYIWRSDLGRELVIASRPIAQGEEVTVQYKTCYGPRAMRQALMRKHFNFDCACAACKEPSHEEEERRQQMQMLYDQLTKTGFTNASEAVETGMHLLRLMEEEELNTPVDLMRIRYALYQLSAADADALGSREHLRRAIECALLCEGDRSPHAMSYSAELESLG